MASQKEVIKAFMKSLDKTTASGVNALNEAVKACSKFKSLQSVINQLINDCKSATSVDEFLQKKCGIILNNDDTGAITGSDAGGSKIKTVESVVPETGKASYPSGTSFTKRGLKVIVPKKSSLTKTERIIVQGLYNWWIDEALKLIEESYGYSFTDDDATVKEITLEFVDDPSLDVMAYVTPSFSSTDSSKVDKLTLTVNIDRFKNISADNVNGSEETYPFYLDRVLAHELTHAIMAAKVDNFSDLPNFIVEGMAELTHGADDIRTSEIKNLIIDPSPLEMIFSGIYETNLDYAAGYIFLRYLAKQVSEGNDTIPADPNVAEFIENTLDGAIIQTQNGDDTITNSGSNVSINAGEGDDTVYNGHYGVSATINTGKGNDYVYNGVYSSLSKISLGAGNDTLVNKNSERIIVNGGKGNDLIDIDASSDNVLVEYAVGDGNDTVYGYYLTDTVSLTGGAITDTSITDGNLILKTNSGSITFIDALTVNVNGTIYGNSATLGTNSNDNLVNFDSNITLKGYGGNDTIDNYGGNVLINVGKGKNLIRNYAPSTVITGNGDNTIYNGGGSKIICGTGNDSVYNDWVSSIIETGAGNDTIINNFVSLLKGGKGDDYLYNNGDYATVIGGEGNDTIYAYGGWGGYEIIEYITGDGNDVVYGYNSNDTILIVRKYTTSIIDNDVIIKVDDGSILLKDAVNEKINIANTESLLISGTDTDDSIENVLSSATINVLGGNDTIDNLGSNCSISGGRGNDSIYNYGSKVTIDAGDGDDTITNRNNYSRGNNISISGGAGNDYIQNEGNNVTINGGKGNDYVRDSGMGTAYVYSAGNDTLDGFDGIDAIVLGSVKVNSSVRSDDDVILKLSNKKNLTLKNYGANKINLVKSISDVEKINVIHNDDDSIIITGTAKQANFIENFGDDVTINGGDGNDKIENRFTYNGRGNNVLIHCGAGNDSVENDGKNVTIEGGAGNDSIQSFRDNVTINGGTGNDSIYSGGENILFKYATGDAKDIIEGFNDSSTLQIGDGTGTYSSKRSGKNIIVTVGKGKITLSGAANLSTVNISGTDKSTNAWTLSGTTATYGTWNSTLVTVSGVKSLDGLSLKDKVVTLSAKALGTDKVTISDGYTLALANDVTKTSTSAAGWTLNKSIATYKNASTNAGYVCDGKNISYVNASGGNTLVTVSGVKSTKGLALNGKVVTVSKAALGTSKVTVSNGYKLLLGKNVTKSTTSEKWSLNKNTATLKRTKTAGYNLADNAINYSAKSTATLAKVTDVKSTKDISTKNNVITLKASSLNKKVTVNGIHRDNFPYQRRHV